MTGWLPKEILDHLEHAGYVAIPKECIEEFHVTEHVDEFELICRNPDYVKDIERSIVAKMGQMMGRMLMEKGFIDLQVMKFDETRTFQHRGSIHVLKPRVIRKDPS